MADWKKRVVFVFCAIVAMALGLASRRYGSSLPEFIADNAGDACWTALVYCGISFWIPNTRILTRAGLTLAFAYAIETSQLYHAPWIDSIRATKLGGLVLGFEFVWIDFVRYAAGVLICAMIEWYRLPASGVKTLIGFAPQPGSLCHGYSAN